MNGFLLKQGCETIQHNIIDDQALWIRVCAGMTNQREKIFAYVKILRACATVNSLKTK
jgi:hypothetical protein